MTVSALPENPEAAGNWRCSPGLHLSIWSILESQTNTFSEISGAGACAGSFA